MKLETARILLTGAAGGIGSAMAAELLAQGAEVLLVDVNAVALARLVDSRLADYRDRLECFAANLTVAAERAALCAHAKRWRGGVNVLVNNAGVSHLALFEQQSAEHIDLALAVNLQAPMQLTRLLLPHLLAQPDAHILNTGSVFGGIGHPGYAVYCATKFGVHGFTEALRRELADGPVRVHYLAPRATRTGINSPAAERLSAELGSAMDPPEVVAAAARRMLEEDVNEQVVGWPEKLFVRLNALLPSLVDGALRRQLPVIRRHASASTAAPAATTLLPVSTP